VATKRRRFQEHRDTVTSKQVGQVVEMLIEGMGQKNPTNNKVLNHSIFVFANLTTATNSRRAASSDNSTESKSESAEREALQTNWETGKRKYPRYR